MLGINGKHVIWTLVGVGLVVACTFLITIVTLWGAAGALQDIFPFLPEA